MNKQNPTQDSSANNKYHDQYIMINILQMWFSYILVYMNK